MTANGKTGKRTDARGIVKTGTVQVTGSRVEVSDRQTWRDWVPEGYPEPPHLITRAELLGELNRDGIDVNARTLMYWESAGVLPRPVRRQRDGSIKALYPLGWQALVRDVRSLQRNGLSLQEIADEVRHRAQPYLTHKQWTGRAYLDAVSGVGELAKAIELEGAGPITGFRIVFTGPDGKTVAQVALSRASEQDTGASDA